MNQQLKALISVRAKKFIPSHLFVTNFYFKGTQQFTGCFPISEHLVAGSSWPRTFFYTPGVFVLHITAFCLHIVTLYLSTYIIATNLTICVISVGFSEKATEDNHQDAYYLSFCLCMHIIIFVSAHNALFLK